MTTIRQLLLSAMLATATCAHSQVVMNIDATRRGPVISDYQYGLFFEEINHAGDGGLYAELVKNRSFEDGLDGWDKTTTSGVTLQTTTAQVLNGAQQHSLDLYTSSASESRLRGVSNKGYWGMKFEKGKQYRLTLWAKGGNDGYTGNIIARLSKSDGRTIIGEARLEGTVETTKWNKLTATITATDSDNGGQLLLLTSNNGHLYADVISLFPETWNNRPNGLRPDLAQLLYDTKPTFLRFPGGCFVEGEQSFDDAFQWKRTIGPIEQRPGHVNRNWHYWTTDGLGFDEYLQLCEDLGAAPLFVVNVGLGHGYYIPMEDLDTLVQNTLDAIEYANGDGTTEYGAMRIKNGHIAPYNLKFIEIGNENYNFSINSNSDQSYEYPERYYKFYNAIKAKYPDIITIGNVEAWGTDAPSWRNDYPVELVDEHYYRSHSWMKQNYRKYDNYPRNIGVYNGEYAANYGGTYGQYGNMNSALGEAVYMLGMERNSDVCRMASFAPIFMHESDPTWAYDMIHFNAGGNFVTPSYYVQKLLSNNLGHQNLLWTESGNSVAAAANHRVGVATWDTQATFSGLTVSVDGGTNILSANSGMTDTTGDWNFAQDGTITQYGYGQPCRAVVDKDFLAQNYTFELKARKDGGVEGFLIIFDYQDENNYSWWNIGGWSNSKNAIEICRSGSKAQYSTTNCRIETGEWYDLKVEVNGNVIKCYINGELFHDLTLDAEPAVYQSVQLTSDEKQLIVKVVNPNATPQQLHLNATNMKIGGGSVERLSSTNGSDENTMDSPDNVKPSAPEAVADGTKLELPPYSLSIYHLNVSDVAPAVATPTAADYPEYVKEDENMTAYLYAHMHETQEYTCYALRTKDANTWNDLLGSREVFDTKAQTVTGGMRDAFVYRLVSGNGFMLVGTDMTSRLGWESNHIMDLMLTPDLVHWTKNVKIDLETAENLSAISTAMGREITAETMTAAWAPQVIYDPKTKTYVIYYSVGIRGDKHYIFYQQLDEQLNILTEPRVYFAPGYDIIDADIVWNAVDQQYQMLFKCESTNGFDRATAKTLVPEKGATGTTVWTVTKDFHIGENGQAIEGMTQWRPIGELKWTVSYINYSGGYKYRFRYMDEHGLNPEAAGHDISGNVRAQHGCVMKLTQQEYEFLLDWDKVMTLLPDVKAYHAANPSDKTAEAIKAAEAALNETTTFAENAKAMAKAVELLKDCPTDLRQVYIDKVKKDGKGDLTPLIVNADFSQGASGWSRLPEFTQANGYVAEFWNTNFMMGQTLEGLPNGKYKLTVQSFYRNGNIIPATSAHLNGSEELNAVFYANSAEMPIMSIYDESADIYTMNPYSYPDNVAEANRAFNEYNLYANELEFSVTDGMLSFGIYNFNSEDGDWCCFDNFTLYFLGDDSGVKDVHTSDGDAARKVYDLQGRRVNGNVRHGVYITDKKKILK